MEQPFVFGAIPIYGVLPYSIIVCDGINKSDADFNLCSQCRFTQSDWLIQDRISPKIAVIHVTVVVRILYRLDNRNTIRCIKKK